MLIQTNVLPLCWTELLLTLVQGVAMSTTAFMLLCPLRSNAAILRLPFELWSLANLGTSIIIISLSRGQTRRGRGWGVDMIVNS